MSKEVPYFCNWRTILFKKETNVPALEELEESPFEEKPLSPQVCMSELMYWAKIEGAIGARATVLLEEAQMGRSYFCSRTGCLAIKAAYSGDATHRSGVCVEKTDDYPAPQKLTERSNVLAGVNETQAFYD
jgi:hypothetical protein